MQYKNLKLKIAIATRQNTPSWASTMSGQHGYKYILFVKTEDSHNIQFQYWDSIYNRENGIEPDILSALYCVLSDASLTEYCISANDVMDEYGYDDKKEAARVFNACKKTRRKLESIGLSIDDIYHLLETLQESGY